MTMPQTGPRTVAILCSNDAGPNRATVETIQASIMTNTLQKPDTRQKASLAETRNAPNGGFKRLALPAVAAAVQTVAGAKGRSEDWPAARRRDGKTS